MQYVCEKNVIWFFILWPQGKDKINVSLWFVQGCAVTWLHNIIKVLQNAPKIYKKKSEFSPLIMEGIKNNA